MVDVANDLTILERYRRRHLGYWTKRINHPHFAGDINCSHLTVAMSRIEEHLIETADELVLVGERLRELASTLDDINRRLLAKAVELDTIRQKGAGLSEGSDRGPVA